MDDVYWSCEMSVSGLRPVNKRPSGKKENLVETSSRKSMTLSDDRLEVMSISTP